MRIGQSQSEQKTSQIFSLLRLGALLNNNNKHENN